MKELSKVYEFQSKTICLGRQPEMETWDPAGTLLSPHLPLSLGLLDSGSVH